MSWRTGLARLIGFTRTKASRNRELHDEMEEHIRLEMEDNVERGLDPAEARRLALLKFGNVSTAAEESADSWTLPRFEIFLSDLRLSCRTLVKARGFSVVAVLAIALGTGATTAIFSVLNGVLLRPMNYPEPERVVLVWGADIRNHNLRAQISATDIDDLRRQNNVLEGVTTFGDWTPTLSGTGEGDSGYGQFCAEIWGR